MKKFKKDQLPRKEEKPDLDRNTLNELTLRTQVVGGKAKEDGEPSGSD